MKYANEAAGPENSRSPLPAPEDLLAFMPYRLGFHPTDQLAVLGFTSPPRLEDHVLARMGLLPADTPIGLAEERGATLARALSLRGITCADILCYSRDPEATARTVGPLHRALPTMGVEICKAIGTDGSLWWPLRPAEPGGRGSGIRFDLSTHPITLAAVLNGLVAHSDEQAAAWVELAPRATSTMADTIRLAAKNRDADLHAESSRFELCRFLRKAEGGSFDPDEAQIAEILVCLRDEEAHDEALCHIDRDTAARSVEIWQNLARRTPSPHNAVPLSLVAFAAWAAGDATLSHQAYELALSIEPASVAAQMARDAVTRIADPRHWQPPPRRCAARPGPLDRLPPIATRHQSRHMPGGESINDSGATSSTDPPRQRGRPRDGPMP